MMIRIQGVQMRRLRERPEQRPTNTHNLALPMTCGLLGGSDKYKNYLPNGPKVTQSLVKTGLIRLL